MTSSSSNQNILTLSLEKNGDEYKKFIENIGDEHLYKFQPDQEEARNDSDPDEFLKELAKRLETSPLTRTPSIKDLLIDGVGKWYFKVKLRHENVQLEVLIRTVDLYLVGYKENDEEWILLQSETYFQKNQVDKWFEVAGGGQGSGNTRQTDLGDSYYHLFGACRPGFKAGIDKEVDAALLDFMREKIKENDIQLKNCVKNLKLEQTKLKKKKNDGTTDKKERQEQKIITMKHNRDWWQDMEQKISTGNSTAQMLIDDLEAKKEAQSSNKLTKLEELLLVKGLNLSLEIKLKWVREKTQELDLNREALINAVNYLKSEPFNQEGSAEHVLTLTIMICEAVRFSKISDHIIKNYCESVVTLDENMAYLIQKWSKGSSVVMSLGKGRPNIMLGANELTLFEFLPLFSSIKSTSAVLRWKRLARTSTSAKAASGTSTSPNTGTTKSADAPISVSEYTERYDNEHGTDDEKHGMKHDKFIEVLEH